MNDVITDVFSKSELDKYTVYICDCYAGWTPENIMFVHGVCSGCKKTIKGILISKEWTPPKDNAERVAELRFKNTDNAT